MKSSIIETMQLIKNLKMISIYGLIFVTQCVLAESNVLPGTNEYLKKDYSVAEQQFKEELKKTPNNPALIYNLGLTYYHQNKKGMALATLYQAIKLDNQLNEAHSLVKKIKSELPNNNIEQKNMDYENFRNWFLRFTSHNLYLFFSVICLFLSGTLIINYLGKRKISLAQENELPDFPTIGVIFSVLFVFFAGASVIKIIDQLTIRGVLIANKNEVKITPGNDQATLFELNEGSEVIIGQIKGEWIQITYPGSLSGWIEKKNILIESDSIGEIIR